MSIFSKIQHAIFGEKGPLGSGHFGTPNTAPQTTAAEPSTPAQTTTSAPAASPPAAVASATSSAAPTPVDVDAVLSDIAERKGSTLNWRSSIVDLMKLLDLDSSLDNRKDLATELGYPGAKDGSADMNIWLHKAVMRELGRNGGVVPSSLKD